jgi:hypothetical protein
LSTQVTAQRRRWVVDPIPPPSAARKTGRAGGGPARRHKGGASCRASRRPVRERPEDTTSTTSEGLTGPALWLVIGAMCLLGLAAMSSVSFLRTSSRWSAVRPGWCAWEVRGSGPLAGSGSGHAGAAAPGPARAGSAPLTRAGAQIHLLATAVCRIVNPARSVELRDPLASIHVIGAVGSES